VRAGDEERVLDPEGSGTLLRYGTIYRIDGMVDRSGVAKGVADRPLLSGYRFSRICSFVGHRREAAESKRLNEITQMLQVKM
jgi:hypothetical protein